MQEKEPGVNVFIMTVLIAGLLVGMGANILLIQRTFIRVDTVFHIALAVAAVVLGIHYIFLRKWNRYFIELLLYSFIGWGSLVAAVFLTLNYAVHGERQTLTYGLKNNMTIDLAAASIPVKIEVDDSLFNDYAYMLSFDEHDISTDQRHVDKASFTIAPGLFGYKILLDKELR